MSQKPLNIQLVETANQEKTYFILVISHTASPKKEALKKIVLSLDSGYTSIKRMFLGVMLSVLEQKERVFKDNEVQLETHTLLACSPLLRWTPHTNSKRSYVKAIRQRL